MVEKGIHKIKPKKVLTNLNQLITLDTMKNLLLYRIAISIIVTAISLMGGASVSAYYNSYPSRLATAKANSITDVYGYGNRNCTSYAAHKLYEKYRFKAMYFGHAKTWLKVASYYKTLGITGTPRAGAVGVRTSGTYGHVVYVHKVVSGGRVYVSEYNGKVKYGYWRGYYSASSFKYIYVK